jgi:hypothetical protein
MGDIDDLRLYDYVLGATEVACLADPNVPPPAHDLSEALDTVLR